MKTSTSPLLIAIMLVLTGLSVVGHAGGQTSALTGREPLGLTCSPAPCLLPPTLASEGGSTVTDSPIVADAQNLKHLLLGSVDFNCPLPNALGFHLSNSGGSTWARYCMVSNTYKGHVYFPVDEPVVGYDRNGTAYIAGLYVGNGSSNHGFVGLQKSSDGTRWSRPVIALQQPKQTFPFDIWLTVDTSPQSPWVNSLYISGIMWSHQGSHNQVIVAHSNDGGTTWTQTSVDAIQKFLASDDYTRVAVGKDGTVYVTWMHCAQTGPDAACSDYMGHMMFAKSKDGGNTWSPPRLMAKVSTAPGALPNTGQGVEDTPALAVDDSKGAHAGNLYVVTYAWTGTYMRVQVIRSTDDGKTWSQPVPVAPPTATHDQFFPAISVSPTGKVGVSWLDRRNDPANVDYQAFAAFSDDGGQTFGKNWQLTQAFSNPDNNGTGNNWMGDYTGNTFAGNDFIAAWMDSSNGIDMQEVVGGVKLK